ncbi:hypothetical protein FPZ43_11655 [Mucilaginibacter pallidiroseus]|uniref:Response regulatory domain-containing protein n=1 Tax=Mucilaginibacter pallidiroseus TaxID=2599295 RepID=A0A563UC50_9SPHI|nr:hypothetical protein [Mucilaginibacter pallidiroseus]TWR28914.1 hypothetical protein FPZ43_11655 [Mucilaginibacter pallidiroseus]
MQAKILVLCKHDGIRETILRLLGNNADWQGIGTNNLFEAKQMLGSDNFDIALLGNGFTEAEESEVTEFVNQHSPGTKTVYHYGGGSGLLSAEIYQALA